ncbi:MAG TPA: GNAT family N-acetyltransferase [Gammaproteobacteria bacterium]|jgi:L-amino acid N-acyltransferase YncA|nr:GNAT family N-acetyltransferase [Gammaproteobacteria bacterium]
MTRNLLLPLPERAMARYPKTITLPDGARVAMRLMTPADRDAVLAFAQSLPEEDLLFLRVDLTQPEVVDDWMRNTASGHSITVVATDDSGMVGYATVHRNPAPWTRRVGEIRVNVNRAYRARGLGRNLTNEIFDLARALGLRKMQANMTADQHGAQAAFRRLGFVPEALLADYVEDRNGQSRDLVIMCYDIGGHSDQAGEPLRL